MRNLKELMKDDGGLATMCGCMGDGVLLCCHNLNCFSVFGQSAYIAVATLITNAWTTWQIDRARWCMTIADSISNVTGK